MADRPRLLLLNGQLVPYADARVHILSTAFKYGAIVFEGLRAYWSESHRQLNGFRLGDHMQRLARSMAATHMKLDRSADDLCDDLLRLIRANDLREDLHMRVQAFVDEDDGKLASTAPISIAMAAIPMGRFFDKSLNVGVSTWVRISERSMPPRVKAAANYHNSRLALLEAKANGFDDAVLLTEGGKVSEGPGYNLFIVRGGELVTPPTTDSILEGVTRDSLIRIATEQLGLTVRERSIDRTELYAAQEMFFCGSSSEVTPIVSVDRHVLGTGKVGDVTRKLREAFLAIARGDQPDERGWLQPVY